MEITARLTTIILLLAIAIHAACGQKVNVSVYYEVNCPDSIQFVRGSMWRAYQSVPDIMQLELVPYGKASYDKKPDGQVTFDCQHGPSECAGNMVQACALSLFPEDKQVPFVKCMLSQRRPHSAGPTCAASLSLSYDPIEACVSGTAGQQYLLQMGQKTESLDPKMTFVPWININGRHDDAKQDDALEDLKSVVCSAYSGPAKPATCS